MTSDWRHPMGLCHPVVTSRTKCDLAVLWKVAGDMNHVSGMSHVTLRNEPCCTSKLVTSRIWMSHVTRNTSEVKPRVLVTWYKDARNVRHTLQHTAIHCNTLQLNATHGNTLQHTATHCNTLQHTATHTSTWHGTKSLVIWVTSHSWLNNVPNESHATHMIESHHTYEWVTSHIWMSHITHMNESRHRYE